MLARVVSVDSVAPRHCPVSVSVYELRAYPRGGSPYRRRGNEPIVLARTTSGSGRPHWMNRAAELITAADAPLGVCQALIKQARREIRSEAARRR